MRNLILAFAVMAVSFSSLANADLHDAVYRSIAVKRPDARVIPQMVHLSQDERAARITT